MNITFPELPEELKKLYGITEIGQHPTIPRSGWRVWVDSGSSIAIIHFNEPDAGYTVGMCRPGSGYWTWATQVFDPQEGADLIYHRLLLGEFE